MRYVVQIDFSTSEVDLDSGNAGFEDGLTRLYVAVRALSAWSRQEATGRVDFLLCEAAGPDELISIAKRIHETIHVRPVFLPEKQPEPLFGF